jgi:ribonuclease PH
VARPDGRPAGALRSVSFERGANPHAEGSCLVRFGETVVLCTASVLESVPSWRRGQGIGWLTAEYAMLPRATQERTARERTGPGGRTQEIQRLIGRSLRGSLATFAFGERTIQIDCDVLQADGGTRTAAITGAAIALADACRWLADHRDVPDPFGRLVAAVSVGLVGGVPVLDLCYAEDKTADVDANVVVLEPDRYVEVQATGEAGHFDRGDLDAMLRLADAGIAELFRRQREALA